MTFQVGYLTLHKFKRGNGATWRLQYRDADDVKRITVLGTLAELPTRGAAKKKAADFLAPINGGRRQIKPATVGELIARYRAEELPERRSTRAAYSSLLAKHIEPRWAALSIRDVRPGPVEEWMRSLTLAPKTKANVRQLLHVLFECARRWEWCDENPITLVRQSAKRTKKLPRIGPAEYRSILAIVQQPVLSMLLLVGCCGLRVGEALGAQWDDIDEQRSVLTLRRDIYQGAVDELKTPAAAREIPLPAAVMASLKEWFKATPYKGPKHYVFSQNNGHAENADRLRTEVLHKISQSLGLGDVGWHAYRHLYGSMLKVVGATDVVSQELLGHTDPATTRIYQHAFEQDKREANDRVAALVFGAKE